MSTSCQLKIYEPGREPKTVYFEVDYVDYANPPVFNEDGTLLEQYRVIYENFSDTESEPVINVTTSMQEYLDSCPPDSSKKRKKIDRFKKLKLESKMKKLKNKNRKQRKKELFNMMNDAMNNSGDFLNDSQTTEQVKWINDDKDWPNKKNSAKISNNSSRELTTSVVNSPDRNAIRRTIKRRLQKQRKREAKKKNASIQTNGAPVTDSNTSIHTRFPDNSASEVVSGANTTNDHSDRNNDSRNFGNPMINCSATNDNLERDNLVAPLNISDSKVSLKRDAAGESPKQGTSSSSSKNNFSSFNSLDYIPINQEKVEPVKRKNNQFTGTKKNDSAFSSPLRYFNVPIG